MFSKKRWVGVLVMVSLLVTMMAPVVAFAGRPLGWYFQVINDPNILEVSPSIAYNSQREQYLVVWYNDRPGNDDIRAQRISKDGALIGGPFYIAAGAGAERRYPDVAYNSAADQYLVVWEHEDSWGFVGIHGRRVAGNGQVLDANDIEIRSVGSIYTPGSPAVGYALAANRYLVVWQEAFHPSITTDILGQVVKPSGSPANALEGPQVPISHDPGNQARRKPDLAYNLARNEFLVAWEQYAGGGNEDIYATRVKMAGGLGVLGAPLALATSAKDEWAPAVAAIPKPAGVGQYLVVWHYRYQATDGDILGRMVAGDGIVGWPFGVSGIREDQKHPAVAANELGEKYVVAWEQESMPPVVFRTIHAQEVDMGGWALGEDFSCGGLSAANPAVASGRRTSVIVFDDPEFVGNRGIYGQLWGNRAYLPLVIRRH